MPSMTKFTISLGKNTWNHLTIVVVVVNCLLVRGTEEAKNIYNAIGRIKLLLISIKRQNTYQFLIHSFFSGITQISTID